MSGEKQGRVPAAPARSGVAEALAGNQLRLHYQRIISLQTGQTTGVEALLRWEHPQAGLLPPDDFLPEVAHTPLMHEITRWVIREAAREVSRWPGWTVSVNISARDATRAELVEDVRAALALAGLEPGRLTIELTEQAMVENLGEAVDVLSSLRSLGVELALDDFGTGYSSLLYLRDLPFTELKIDRAFMSRVQGSKEDLAIVRSVAALGRTIGLRVVAEGVETHAQASAAVATGCHAAQGYLWGRPVAPRDLRDEPVLGVPRPRLTRPATVRPKETEATTRIQELFAQGASLHTIAAALNREGLRTERHVRWTARSVALHVAGIPSPGA